MVSMASSIDGPMNRSAQSRHRPSSTRLPSIRIRRQSGGQGAVGDDELQGDGLAAAGFAADEHVALGEGDFDAVAEFVGAQVDGFPDRQRRDGDACQPPSPVHLPGELRPPVESTGIRA